MPHRPLTLLWLIGLDHVSGMRHGGNLRWFNLSRELLARGHNVYFAINGAGDPDLAARVDYLTELKRTAFISGHFVLDYPNPGEMSRLGQLIACHPALRDRVLRSSRRDATRALETVIAQNNVDVLVVDRAFLFLVEALGSRKPVIVDWVDCFTLYFWRGFRMRTRRGELRAAASSLRSLFSYCLQERYYGRRAAANLLASPVDKVAFDRVTGRWRQNHALLNGLSIGRPAKQVIKIPSRLVFTGNMDFPPNYEAAIWFIDEIFPRIRARQPAMTFSVAGANPVPALWRRSGDGVEIMGKVPDMSAVLASGGLYVAPLVSGGGFKNKIIEAIACGAFVVSTSRGVEFLDPGIRDLLLIGDSAAAFADRVLEFLDRPAFYDARLPILAARVNEEYSWGRRAEELLVRIRNVTLATRT